MTTCPRCARYTTAPTHCGRSVDVPAVCGCGCRAMAHAYRKASGRNDGRCLGLECGCAGYDEREAA